MRKKPIVPLNEAVLDRISNFMKAVNPKPQLNEAKMKNEDVLKAAKALAKNGKDSKAKEFGAGLVSHYEKNGSFHPNQVSGLQNIMKNAGFQLAEMKKTDEVDSKEADGKFEDRKDKDIDNDGDTDDSDKFLHRRRKAISKAIRESMNRASD